MTDGRHVIVLLDDHETIYSHLLEPQKESCPEPHPVSTGFLLTENYLVSTVSVSDLIWGEVDHLCLESFWSGCSYLSVGCGLYLHLYWMGDLEAAVLWIAEISLKSVNTTHESVFL